MIYHDGRLRGVYLEILESMLPPAFGPQDVERVVDLLRAARSQGFSAKQLYLDSVAGRPSSWRHAPLYAELFPGTRRVLDSVMAHGPRSRSEWHDFLFHRIEGCFDRYGRLA